VVAGALLQAAISPRTLTGGASHRGSTAARRAGTPRLAHERASHRDALPLSPGQLARKALHQRSDLEKLRDLVDTPSHVARGACRACAADTRVPSDRHVRVERVVLEDHRDVAVARRQVVRDFAPDADRAVGDRLESRDHPQKGRLSAARRTDQHEQLAVGDRERAVDERARSVGERLAQMLAIDGGHQSSG
jgi:hypothetical protein